VTEIEEAGLASRKVLSGRCEPPEVKRERRKRMLVSREEVFPGRREPPECERETEANWLVGVSLGGCEPPGERDRVG
jgi:hypothetical protein